MMASILSYTCSLVRLTSTIGSVADWQTSEGVGEDRHCTLLWSKLRALIFTGRYNDR